MTSFDLNEGVPTFPGMNLRYFDHNATTPLAQEARSAWLEAVDGQWLNPSSPYRNAAAVKVRLESAREELANLLGVEPGRLVFCAGATEANNAVFQNWASVLPDGASIAVSPTEHPSVIEAAKAFFEGRIVWFPVDSGGRVDLKVLDELLEECRVEAVSVMAANNETGVLQAWGSIADRCKEAGVAYHCDASQWVGKMPLFGLGECSFVTACAHKFGGPKGAGFLILPNADHACHVLWGGGQEAGRRAGTEDVAGVLSMIAALKAASPQCSADRDRFIAEVSGRIDRIEVVGDNTDCLWNTVSLILPDFQSLRWVRALEKAGFLVSSGSACSSGSAHVSHVLLAMGVDTGKAGRVLRVSSGYNTTTEDWQALADSLCEVYARLKSDSSSGSSRVISLD